jgi:hypothetical protein
VLCDSKWANCVQSAARTQAVTVPLCLLHAMDTNKCGFALHHAHVLQMPV